jgi:hypothetical protein
MQKREEKNCPQTQQNQGFAKMWIMWIKNSFTKSHFRQKSIEVRKYKRLQPF